MGKLLEVRNPDVQVFIQTPSKRFYCQLNRHKLFTRKWLILASNDFQAPEDGTVGGVGTVVDPCPSGFIRSRIGILMFL